MAIVKKATETEQANYISESVSRTGCKPIYPLYGFVKIDGHTCSVEFPNEGPGNPKYEVMAPQGFHFGDGLHSLLCFNMADLQSRICEGLYPCSAACAEQ